MAERPEGDRDFDRLWMRDRELLLNARGEAVFRAGRREVERVWYPAWLEGRDLTLPIRDQREREGEGSFRVLKLDGPDLCRAGTEEEPCRVTVRLRCYRWEGQEAWLAGFLPQQAKRPIIGPGGQREIVVWEKPD